MVVAASSNSPRIRYPTKGIPTRGEVQQDKQDPIMDDRAASRARGVIPRSDSVISS